jgi:hypothetical protein
MDYADTLSNKACSKDKPVGNMAGKLITDAEEQVQLFTANLRE